jgi:protein-tyrosine phosphatase
MSTIIPDKLYLGNAAAGRDLGVLDDRKITHVLRLQSGLGEEEAKNETNSGVASRKVLCLECTDNLGSQNSLANVSSQAVQFIDEALKTGSDSEEPNIVLVHCSAGCSRSPAMTVYWLVHSGSVKAVPEGVKLVRSARPVVDISSDHMAWLLQDREPAKKKS